MCYMHVACSMFWFKKTAKDKFIKVGLQLYENSYMDRRTNLKVLVVHPKMLVASMVGGLKKCLSWNHLKQPEIFNICRAVMWRYHLRSLQI